MGSVSRMATFWEFFGAASRNPSRNDMLIQSVFIVAGVALFGYVLSNITFDDMYNTFSVLGINVLFIVAILLFEMVVSSFRLKTLIGRRYDVPTVSILRIMFETALFAVYSPGKVGELMKLDLFRKKGVKRTYCLASVVVSRVFDLAVVMMLSLGVLFSLDVKMVPVAVLMAAALIVALAVYKLGIFKEFVSNMLDSFKTFLDLKSLVVVFVLSLALWAADAYMPYMVLRMLGYNVDFFQTATIYFASIIIGLVSMVPGGLGASDFSFSYGINHLLGVAEADAVSTIVMLRMITFAVLSIGGLMYFAHIRAAAPVSISSAQPRDMVSQ